MTNDQKGYFSTSITFRPIFFLRRLSVFDDSKFSLNVHVALDNLVVIDQVKVEAEPWKPLLLFLPLRLGICDINPLYFSDVKVKPKVYF